MKIKLGVIFGGETVEHEVSIISALQAIKNIDRTKYDVVPIYISKDRIWYCGYILNDISTYKDIENTKKYLKRVTLYKKGDKFYLQQTSGLFRKDLTDLDVILPVVHGNNVEDGTLAGYLDTIGIPYVSSRVLGSALGQDKVVMKQVFAAAGIPIVDYTWFYDTEYLDGTDEILDRINKIGYPVVVKPATLGSSVGITYVKDESTIKEAIDEAIKYDIKIVVEKAVDNLLEVNCSVLGNYNYQQTSVIEEVISSAEILSYKDKYIGGSKAKGSGSKGMASASRVIPARIAPDMEERIKDISKQAFRALNLSGVCRIDYLIDKKANKVYINEPNTNPGSLSFYLWEPTGKKYEDLLDEMITLAVKDYKNRAKKTYSFTTNILANFKGGLKGAKGAKKLK